MSDSVRPHRWQPTRLPRPWDSPGKNTGVGCHFLLQCMKVKVKSLSRVRLLGTPWAAAYQAPPSMGFSRLEYWSGVPLPSPQYKVVPLQGRVKAEQHVPCSVLRPTRHEPGPPGSPSYRSHFTRKCLLSPAPQVQDPNWNCPWLTPDDFASVRFSPVLAIHFSISVPQPASCKKASPLMINCKHKCRFTTPHLHCRIRGKLCGSLLEKEWHPSPVLLPRKSHGRRSLVGCSPWGP